MKCPKCGKEIAKDSAFCEFCGNQIKQPNHKVIWVVTVVCLLIALLGGLGYYQHRSMQKFKNEFSKQIEQVKGKTTSPGEEDVKVVIDTIVIPEDEPQKDEPRSEEPKKEETQASTSSSNEDVSEFVDLGLSSGTLWRRHNEIGGDYGDGLYTYDQAMRQFGNQLPTKEQLEELFYDCRWRWNGHGYDVTGPNGRSITMPLTGYRESSGNLKNRNITGNYWSQDIRREASYKSWKLYFRSDHKEICSWPRKDYHAVRLVR